MNNYSLREKELIDKLFSFFSTIEIKNNKEADINETKESSLSASIYISAKLQTDSFLTYNYDIDTLLTALNCSEEMANMIIDSKFKLLSDLEKQRLQIFMREKIVEEYEEINDYYRELFGIPKKGEKPLKLSNGKSVTELTNNEIFFTYQDELEALRKKYPTKKYLNRLGENSIDPLFARTSKNFAILYYPKGIFSDEETKKLLDIYYQCLGYVERVLYSKAFVHYDYYNNFMIMLLTIMTMQRYLVQQLENGIRREFIDDESMKNLFLSYGLPYWTNLPTKYKKRIVKNINKLFMHKGTDKVIIDIVSLLGFENVEIFKHYLVKENYVDKFNEIKDQMKFVGVNIKETNIQNAIKTSNIVEGYDDMTVTDPFWGTDENESEVKKVLLEEEFNYLSTKYMSINTIYNVTQLTAEVSYFFQLINHLEKENKIELYFRSLDIKPNGAPIRLYDAIVAIYYLVCKKMNFVDQIIFSNTAMASIYGFNFDTDIETLRRILDEEGLSLSEEYLKIFEEPPGFLRKKDIVDLYFNNREFQDKLEYAMRTCDSYENYKALKRVYDYNMYCKINKDQFKKEDGTYYETYLSYLKDKDNYFALFLEEKSKNKEDLLTTLNNIFYALESFLDSEKFKFVFVGLSALSSEVLKDYLKSLIGFFKSYTAEIKELNSFFVIDDKFLNSIKFISEIKLSSNLNVASYDRNILDLFEDIFTKKVKGFDDSMDLEDIYKLMIDLKISDRIILRDFIAGVSANKDFYDKMDLFDDENIRVLLNKLEKMEFIETLRRIVVLNNKEDLSLQEKLLVKNLFTVIDKGLLDLDDVLQLTNKLSEKDNFNMLDYLILVTVFKLNLNLNLTEKIKLNIDESKAYNIIKFDDIHTTSLIPLRNKHSKLQLNESINIFSNE